MRPALRIAYAYTCICKRAAWGDETTADRVHGAPWRRWNKNKRKNKKSQVEGRRDARGRGFGSGAGGRPAAEEKRKGVGTSDSNYLELRADNRPIRRGPRGFSCRAIAHAVTLLPIAYRPRTTRNDPAGRYRCGRDTVTGVQARMMSDVSAPSGYGAWDRPPRDTSFSASSGAEARSARDDAVRCCTKMLRSYSSLLLPLCRELSFLFLSYARSMQWSCIL